MARENRLKAVRTSTILLLLLTALPQAVPAQEEVCSAYALYGLVPGMGLKEVHGILAAGGMEAETGTFRSELMNVEVYRNLPVTLQLEYDRPVTRKNHTTLMVLRTYAPASDLDPADLRTSLLHKYGEPLSGGPNLQEGLVRGPAVWVDESCNIEVTVYRRPAEWWQGREETICVEIRRMDDLMPVPVQGR
jgi:hypothetical protein